MIVLLGGPAGAGKSTVGIHWCSQRPRAAMVVLDAVRDLIVGGRADPQIPTADQADQYVMSVRASAALARVFDDDRYDVVVEDVFEPDVFERQWRPLLAGLRTAVVIIRPSLQATLRRGSERAKSVMEHHVRRQHAATGRWPDDIVVDSSGLTVEQTCARVDAILSRYSVRSRVWVRAGPLQR
jgi:hypothetical protein